MWLLVIVIFIISLFVYLLFAPLVIKIDTRTGLFMLRFHYLVSARLSVEGDHLFIDMVILGYRARMDLLGKKSEVKTNRKVIKKRKSKNRNRMTMKKMISISQTFRIKKFIFRVNTGSVTLNGTLYPLLLIWAVVAKKDVNVSFSGCNILVLHARNNMARLAYAFISGDR